MILPSYAVAKSQAGGRVAHRRRSAILTCAPLTAMLKRLLEVTM